MPLLLAPFPSSRNYVFARLNTGNISGFPPPESWSRSRKNPEGNGCRFRFGAKIPDRVAQQYFSHIKLGPFKKKQNRNGYTYLSCRNHSNPFPPHPCSNISVRGPPAPEQPSPRLLTPRLFFSLDISAIKFHLRLRFSPPLFSPSRTFLANKGTVAPPPPFFSIRKSGRKTSGMGFFSPSLFFGYRGRKKVGSREGGNWRLGPRPGPALTEIGGSRAGAGEREEEFLSAFLPLRPHFFSFCCAV